MPVGHSHVWGVPLACLGCFLPAWHDEGPGCRCGSGLLSSGAGSARCVSRLWCAERALGRPEGGAGETGGNPGLWGGLPRVSPAMLAGFPVRQAQRGIRRPRGARHPRPLPRPWVLAGTGVRPAFHGHWCGGVRRCLLGEGGGVWGTWNRAVFFGAGGVPGSPVRFRIGPPSCLFTRVVEL